MGLFMRAVVGSWLEPAFDELAGFVGGQGEGFAVVSPGGDGWGDFEVHDRQGEVVLVGDLTRGVDAREELAELVEFLVGHDGSAAARATVQSHLASASAVVGLQIIMSRYDESVAAANQVIAFLEKSPGVLTQVDTVGWYDGQQLILSEAGK